MAIRDVSNLPDDQVPEWVRQSRQHKRQKMLNDKAVIESASQERLEAIIKMNDFDVIRGDRGTVLALVPRGLSPQGWQRLFDYVLDKYKNLGRVGS